MGIRTRNLVSMHIRIVPLPTELLREFLKTRFSRCMLYNYNYIGTMPRLVQIETGFLEIIHYISKPTKYVDVNYFIMRSCTNLIDAAGQGAHRYRQ